IANSWLETWVKSFIVILVEFLASGALMMPGGAALARAYGTQVELCPRRFSSSQASDAKKPAR
ncbi:hypothetical protein, partial [Klebsiella variicola]|uniref:hypothetical protein n=1 Tax=Klebsiella variicola TaxID=244366 RepID=UPI0019559C13